MLWNKTMLAIGGFLLSLQVMASGSILINGSEVQTKEQLHTLLSKHLNFPDYYGGNLDSLYDVLSTDFTGESVIRINHLNKLKATLGSEYVENFIQVILDASEDNPHINLILSN